MERVSQTLQDRLVKEMRLQGIHDIDTANTFLPAFIEHYNRRFAVAPQDPHDAHRPVVHTPRELALILCLHHTRILSKNLTLQFQNREYQIQRRGAGYSMRNSKVTVCEAFGGGVTILYKGRVLPYQVLAEGEPPIPLDDEEKRSRHHPTGQRGSTQKTRLQAPSRPSLETTQLPRDARPSGN